MCCLKFSQMEVMTLLFALWRWVSRNTWAPQDGGADGWMLHLQDVNEWWQAATTTTEADALMMEATVQLLNDGGRVLGGLSRRCGGLLYHLGVGCHVGVFQGIDGAHYTVLTVVGGRLGRERRHSGWTHTFYTDVITHTDALEEQRLSGSGANAGGGSRAVKS